MPHDGTGTNWDTTDPADSDPLPYGATEIRDLRKGVELRLEREHEEMLDGGAGGEHLKGSAKAYFQGSAPTKRPDTVSDLGDADKGRIWCNNGIWSVWGGDDAGWIKCSIADSSQVGNKAITTEKLDDLAVTQEKIALGAVGGNQLEASAVQTANIAPQAVTGSKIANGTITPNKLSAGAGGTTFAHLTYEVSPGTNGGTASAGTWDTRALVEKADPGGIVTVTASQFTLAAGTYFIRAEAQCYRVADNQLRIRNITDGSTPLVGMSGHAGTGDTSTHLATLMGIMTIAGTKTFALQHYVDTSTGATDFGKPVSNDIEVYTNVEILKIS